MAIEQTKSLKNILNSLEELGILLFFIALSDSLLAHTKQEKEPWYKFPILYAELIILTIASVMLFGIVKVFGIDKALP